ncbi:MAG: fumarylacetoacetate hydrolase family protein [Deltaproteobacteria bacterium]|nr:fumarylacetoacetate hydrolase family protein [Deltaproteobacteria bacterium]
MDQNRRDFLKGAGIAAAVAVTGGLTAERVEAQPAKTKERGMARGLTLLTMGRNGEYMLGVKTDKGILNVPQAAKILDMHAPTTMDDLLQKEEGPSLNALVDAALKSGAASPAFAQESAIKFGPVVTRPEKIVCVGLNYRKHAKEIGMPFPSQPVLFNKYNNTLNNHNGSIKLPVDVAKKFDYEVELVIVMGKEAKNVPESDALSYVAGYCTGNDFSARDLQLETPSKQWMIGKTPDQFAPIGPYMVTADQIDPDNLKIECRVNGQTRQSSNTNDFIFNSKQMISFISRHLTLKPGDIIFTGTPGGVILGYPKEKQVWLKPGDKLACSLEKLGELKFELV